MGSIPAVLGCPVWETLKQPARGTHPLLNSARGTGCVRDELGLHIAVLGPHLDHRRGASKGPGPVFGLASAQDRPCTVPGLSLPSAQWGCKDGEAPEKHCQELQMPRHGLLSAAQKPESVPCDLRRTCSMLSLNPLQVMKPKHRLVAFAQSHSGMEWESGIGIWIPSLMFLFVFHLKRNISQLTPLGI